MKNIKKYLPIGQSIRFHSGNFMGMYGVVTKVTEGVKNSLYGWIVEVDLSNGKTGYVEKTEHFTKIKTIQPPNPNNTLSHE